MATAEMPIIRRRTFKRPSASDIQPERIRPEALPAAPMTSVMAASASARNVHALGERDELADDHQARRGTQRVRDPHEIERGGAQHLPGSELVGRRQRLGLGSGRPTRDLIPGRRVLQQQRSDEGHHEKDDAQYGEGGAPAVRGDEPQVGHGSEDRRTAAVAGHRQPDGQTALVRKPLGHDRDRRRVAEAVTDADDDAEADDQVRQARRCGRRAGSPWSRECSRSATPGTDPSLSCNRPARMKRNREHDDGPGKHLGCVRPLPAELLLQRRDEDAPGVE